MGFLGVQPISGVSKERVTLWSGCIGLKALAGFLGQRPKPLGRAHNFGAQRRSYSGLYLGKPSHSRHANGVPLKSHAVRPSVPPAYVGVVHAANRAVLRFFRAFYGVIAMLSVAFFRHGYCRLRPPHPLCHPN